MPPPAAVIVIASVATTAVVAYVVKEAWEPHIKPELLKARHAARAWWSKRRPLTPIRVNALGFKRKDVKRPQSPEVPDEHHSGGSACLEMLGSRALELPADTQDGIRLHRRSAADRAATPSETVVEMSELDKTNPWIVQAPISPSVAATQGSARHSISTSSIADPFTNTLSSDRSTGSFALSPPTLGRDNGLQLSFPGSSPSLNIPTAQSNIAPHPNLNAANAGSSFPMTQPDRASFTPSPASIFSWADAASAAVDGSRLMSFPASTGDDFVHLRDDDAERSEHAFSIGSYDDLTGSSAHGASEMPHDNRSDAGFVSDDDEPTSPPHNSEQGSPRMRSSSSSSGWESVGSPSSDGRRLA